LGRSGYVNEAGARGRLFAMVGLPHSGKSTWANQWVRQPLAPRLAHLREDWCTIRGDLLSQVEHLVLRDA
jgi:predicted kinase